MTRVQFDRVFGAVFATGSVIKHVLLLLPIEGVRRLILFTKLPTPRFTLRLLLKKLRSDITFFHHSKDTTLNIAFR